LGVLQKKYQRCFVSATSVDPVGVEYGHLKMFTIRFDKIANEAEGKGLDHQAIDIGHCGQTRPNVGEEKKVDHGQAKAESNQKELNEDGAGNCRSYYFSKPKIKLN